MVTGSATLSLELLGAVRRIRFPRTIAKPCGGACTILASGPAAAWNSCSDVGQFDPCARVVFRHTDIKERSGGHEQVKWEIGDRLR